MKKVLFLSILLLSFTVHKFYVSVSEIRFNTESKQLEISSRLFIDDLESVIPALKIIEDNDSLANTLIEPYLLSQMHVTINDNETPLSYIGYEIEDDVIWCYLESGQSERPVKVDLSFDMLLNEFEDQTNIVHFELDKEVKSVFIKNDSRDGMLDFESGKN